jgi:hypothetical protein
VLNSHEFPATVATASAPAAAGSERAREQILYSSASGPGTRGAVLIDERDETPGSVERRDAVSSRTAGAAAQSRETAGPPSEPRPARAEPARPPSVVPRARPWDIPLDAAGPDTGELRDARVHAAPPDGADAELRVTRGPGATVDERA